MQLLNIVTKVTSSIPAHTEVYSIQDHSDFRKFDGFLWVYMVSSTNITDYMYHDINDIILKVTLYTHKHIPLQLTDSSYKVFISNYKTIDLLL